MAGVGSNIRTFRKKRNMTQDELAQRLFVSRQTVSNYETGKSNPDIDMLVRIAGELEADVNELIFGPAQKPGRKKELHRLAVQSTFFLMLLLAASWLRPVIDQWTTDTFDIGPLALYLTLTPPLLSLAVGWIAVQAACVLTGARRIRTGWARAAFLAAALVTAAYFLSLLPLCVVRGYGTVRMLLLHFEKGSLPRLFSDPVYAAVARISSPAYVLVTFRRYETCALFAAAGGALWYGRRAGAEVTAPPRSAPENAEAPDSVPPSSTPR
ncbi:MAG: helix-turn-helix transcriptional regulator [Eubacteriales bacterium]|nr:helix-turn-helix transcriptional regulator [Eubacteriales bacterium]